MRFKGLERGGEGRYRLYTEQRFPRARVLDWAGMGDSRLIDFAGPLMCQAF